MCILSKLYCLAGKQDIKVTKAFFNLMNEFKIVLPHEDIEKLRFYLN